MRQRALVALLLALALAGLTPLARLSPPDPTWFAGFWDDGDHDDVVLLVCATAAALHAPTTVPDSRRVVAGTPPMAEASAPPLRAGAPVATRAPPRV
ncbi:MAG: hypothetical protein DMD76_05300 [Candidatus Rokuibacteriota bacterium]|nr:MAG: hypothetical protein DMD76_05300 [Candidatus Rokubacteria bacterium]